MPGFTYEELCSYAKKSVDKEAQQVSIFKESMNFGKQIFSIGSRFNNDLKTINNVLETILDGKIESTANEEESNCDDRSVKEMTEELAAKYYRLYDSLFETHKLIQEVIKPPILAKLFFLFYYRAEYKKMLQNIEDVIIFFDFLSTRLSGKTVSKDELIDSLSDED